MRAIAWAALWFLLAVPNVVFGAGLAQNRNFIVLAPDQLLADEVLAKADSYREELARDLLGEKLPPGSGQTIINVSVSKTEDSAVTWPIDSPGRKYHKVWLTTSEEKATGNALRHELVHVLLSTRFPQQLPAWLEEGLAGRGDDPGRLGTRRRIADAWARSGNWPDLKAILDRQLISADDQTAYSVACSLTEFLLSRGDMKALLRFGVQQKTAGWNEALQQHYHIATLRVLQQGWREWIAQRAGADDRTAAIVLPCRPTDGFEGKRR